MNGRTNRGPLPPALGRNGSVPATAAPTRDAAPAWPTPAPRTVPSVQLVDRAERGYEPGLVGDLVALQARIYGPIFGVDGRFEVERASEIAAFLASFDASRDGLWTAQLGGRTVGSAALDGRDGCDRTLRWVVLEPEARGRGVGRALVRSAIEHARAAGARVVELESHELLTAALGLYRSLGFELDRKFERTIGGVTYPMLHMSLRLALPEPVMV